MQLKEGTELQSGKYRAVRVLGQGGFGITYLVENVFLGKLVAIKEFFPKDFCGRDSTSRLTLGTQNNAETVGRLKERFLKEAKNIAKLDHPGIVKIHDIFEENNTAYYVMDYIEGENLNEMVKRGGALSEQKALEYIRKVGDALDYVHSRNMTHFDVKPANIVVRHSDNQPILVDFGLSKQYDAQGEATSTLTPAVSQGYSPIELYNPGSLQTFSPETDVYSLGATLYYLITGVNPPACTYLVDNELDYPNVVRPQIKTAIANAMTFSKKKRFGRVAEFLNHCGSASIEATQVLSNFQKERPLSAEELARKGFEARKSENYEEAFKFFLQAAEKGHGRSMAQVSYMYEHGQGVKKNEQEAVRWCRLGAELDDVYALYYLGSHYEYGTCGISEDLTKAGEYYSKCALSEESYEIVEKARCRLVEIKRKLCGWVSALSLADDFAKSGNLNPLRELFNYLFNNYYSEGRFERMYFILKKYDSQEAETLLKKAWERKKSELGWNPSFWEVVLYVLMLCGVCIVCIFFLINCVIPLFNPSFIVGSLIFMAYSVVSISLCLHAIYSLMRIVGIRRWRRRNPNSPFVKYLEE